MAARLGGRGLYVSTLPQAFAFAAVCLILFLIFNYVVVATARAHAAVARGLLGPAEDPLRKAKEILGRPGPLSASTQELRWLDQKPLTLCHKVESTLWHRVDWGELSMSATSGRGADNAVNFDPRQAAALLDQTARRARRQLQPSRPWLLVTRAVMVLAALGVIWLSVRGQHPYRGPAAAEVAVLVAFIVVNFTATVAVRHRATAGVRGRSRLRRGEISVLTLAWVPVVAVMIALAAAGLSDRLYPTTVLIIPGLAWAAVTATRGNWGSCVTGLAVVAVGVAGLFAGPAGSWAVGGVGLCLVLLGRAAVIAWRLRTHESS